MLMVKFSTKLSFDICLESRYVKRTIKASSKALKVVKEIIRTRLRKEDVVDSG